MGEHPNPDQGRGLQEKESLKLPKRRSYLGKGGLEAHNSRVRACKTQMLQRENDRSTKVRQVHDDI